MQTRIRLGMFSVFAVVALAACADDSPIGPNPRPATPVTPLAVDRGADHRTPRPACLDSIEVPAGNRLTTRLFATGYQIYEWNGTTWTFVEPWAQLFANKYDQMPIGTHYIGPTWETTRGSKVTGAVSRRCTVESGSIPWLLLTATPVSDRGIFAKVTFIQRVRTSGGIAPTEPGTTIGQWSSVPYTSEYLFYRKK